MRFLNSYHSNLIEGHKTSILEIEAALNKDFSIDEQKRYAQELCAAHVQIERELMQALLTSPVANICEFEFVGKIHKKFYEQLPAHHQYTHSQDGFTSYSVMPGKMRDEKVSLGGGRTLHGPDAKKPPALYEAFSRLYESCKFSWG